MTRSYNFSNPMYGRKWLKLLHDDPVSGIRIQPNLELPRSRLGFSFRSNALGLRGPADCLAPNVIIGSSFGMGFAVDNGLNWYERCLEGAWLNLSLPVGILQLQALLGTFHKGISRLALVLFHPNFWVQTRLFGICAQRGDSVFRGMGWQTDYLPCLRLAFRRLRRRAGEVRRGELLDFRYSGQRYEMDALYNRFEFGKHTETADLVCTTMQSMLSRFEKVIVIRTLLKQDMVPPEKQNVLLRETLHNHESGWELFMGRLKGHRDIQFHVTQGFTLEDFFPLDNHWTPRGNEKFAGMVRSLLAMKDDRQ